MNRATFARRISVGLLAASVFATPSMAQPGDGQRDGAGQNEQRRPRGERGGGERRREQVAIGGPGGGGGFMQRMTQVFEPSVTSADLDRWSTRMNLTPEQQDTASALLEAYQTQFAAEAKTARDQIEVLREEARAAGDPSMFGEIMEARQAFSKRREAMEKTLFDDLKSLFDDRQATEWAAIEKDRRRQQSLPQGMIAGERADVARLVENLELTEEQSRALAPVLAQYRDELDRELIVRNEAYEKVQGRMRDFVQGGADDELEKLVTDGRSAGMRVRDVNRKYARMIEPMLPLDKQAAFSTAVKRESYPQVYRPGRGTRVLESAGEIEDLSADQRAALDAIRDQYSRDLAALQTQMEKAIEDQQASFSVAAMRERGPGGWGGRDSAMGELEGKRRELDTAAYDKVKGLLTPEQAEKLPQPRAGGWGEGWGGGGGAGGGEGRRGRGRGGDDAGGGERNDDNGGDRPRRRRGGGGGGGGEGGGGRSSPDGTT